MLRQEDKLELALYADPAHWLYGLLFFCAKACEAKIDEANGTVALYALPSEWLLARVSVHTRHIGVLLRVTLKQKTGRIKLQGSCVPRPAPRGN